MVFYAIIICYYLVLTCYYAYSMSPRVFVERFAENRAASYTVIPTVSRRCLQLDFHVDRLLGSTISLDNRLEIASGTFRSDFIASVKQVLQSLEFPSTINSTGFITICTETPSQLHALYTTAPIIGLLSELTKWDLIEVDVCDYQRSRPTAKSCSWTVERKPIEAARKSGIAETILCDRMNLLEGLTSSLFVIERGTVVTAGDGAVLEGSIAQIVLSVCEELGVPVRRACPSLECAHMWSSAFLTSISAFPYSLWLYDDAK